MTSFSVVIPTLRRPDALRRAIESLFACAPLPDEIVAATRARYVEAYERLTGQPF